MQIRPLTMLISACLIAFGLAFVTFSSGAGLIAAFLVYSLSGSTAVVALSFANYMAEDQDDEAYLQALLKA